MKTNLKIYKKVKEKIIKIYEVIIKSWYDFYISALCCNWYMETQSKVQKYNTNRMCNLKDCLWKIVALLTLQIEEIRHLME